ncbi:MAG: hypothetical protein ACTSU2_11940 [Promethearchaeota archaeon]
MVDGSDSGSSKEAELKKNLEQTKINKVDQNKNENKIEDEILEETEENKEEQMVSVPIFVYLELNLITGVLTFFIPLLIFLGYILFMNNTDANTLFHLAPSTIMGIDNFWTYVFLPPILILCLISYIVSVILVSNIFVKKWNKKSPPVQGVFDRKFNDKDVEDQRIKYYHYRGFIIKYPLWIASKLFFPWMGTWALKKIGHNHIDKNVILVQAMPSLEFTTLKSGVIYLPGASSSSHVVDSIFGNLSILEVHVGENSIVHSGVMVGPGALVEENNNIMPNTLCPKRWRKKGEGFFHSGTPAKPIDKIYSGIFSVLPSDAQEIYKEKGAITFEEIEELTK